MVGLARIGAPWIRWVRFFWSLQLLWITLGLLFLLIAHAIQWRLF